MPKQNRCKATLDDGCNPELATGALFGGTLEIPIVEPPAEIVIPTGMTPYSKATRHPSNDEMCVFFEQDHEFADVLINPDVCIEKLRRFPMVAQVDCSLFRDMPLAAQIANLYRSRLIASHWQRNGLSVWPLARWSDERTYTDELLPEPPAFMGIRHGSPVVVGAYGVLRNREDRKHFLGGFEALVDHIEPEVVLIYGKSHRDLYGHLRSKTEIYEYPNWTQRMRGGE